MLHFKQNRLNLFIYFQVIPSPAAWSMKLQWDHMHLLQCGLLCVGSTLELRCQGRLPCTDTIVAYLSGGQMNTVMLDYLSIQIFHNEIDIPF